MGKVLTNSLAFSLLIILILPTLSQNDLNNPDDILYTEVIDGEDDAWLNLELLSWRGNSSTTWDTDDTDMDVQFQVCIDLDGELDGISPLCTWTEVWNNTLTLSNAWDTTFDLIEDNTSLNITIECWDNDDFADEWNNGPDACDMNPLDDEWRLYYVVNWSNITTETFTGDGSVGNDNQWGNAESTWKVTIIYHGDDDSDGISNNIDICSESNSEDKVDGNGCSVFQYDWDSDGIYNENDECPTILDETCYASGNYVLIDTYLSEDYNPKGFGDAFLGMSGDGWDISPDGEYLAFIIGHSNQNTVCPLYGFVVIDLVTKEEFCLGSWVATDTQTLRFSPNGEYLINIIGGIGTERINFYNTSYGFPIIDSISSTELSDKCGYKPPGDYINLGHEVSYSLNSKFVQIKCPWNTMVGDHYDSHKLYYDLSEISMVGGGDLSSFESGIIFEEYTFKNSLVIDFSNIIVNWNANGFEINSSGEIFPVDWNWGDGPTQISATDDGNTLYVVSSTKSEIYNLSTGQVISLPASSGGTDGEISSNGLRIILNIDNYGWNVYERDTDLDGELDSNDLCPLIQGPWMGCLERQWDSDGDGINDEYDLCSETIDGATVDGNGCALTQLDSDADGISDATDQCPSTPNSETVGLTGCSSSQIDSDSDGIYDSEDDCPSSLSGSTVDATGCAPDDVVNLDSDGDGVRDSVDECSNSEQGIITNENGCEIVFNSRAESPDGGYYDAFCCFGFLFAFAIIVGGVKKKLLGRTKWLFLLAFFLLVGFHDIFLQMSWDLDDSYTCPEGTIVTYGESREIRSETGQDLQEFMDNPPPEWCTGAVNWLDELTDMYIGKLFTIYSVILSLTAILSMLIGYMLVPNKVRIIERSLKNKSIVEETASASFPASVVSSSPVVNPSRAKKDLLKHLEVGGWISHVDDDGTEWWEDSDETWWYRQQGEGDWEQWIDGNTPKEKNSSKQSKPTLVSQASSKPMARESASAKQNLSHKLPAPKVIRMEDVGLKGKVNEIIVPSASQPMDLNTNVLANSSYSEPQEKKSKITTDSSGITTIETAFSIVTLNKLTDEVTKVPIGTEQHEMFYQEIRNMKHLDSKGFDVGLIDYGDGSNPKIVTRYMGPSKLSEQFQTLSNRGKKKLILDLVEQVAQIHKCGMVHRDLKPDNILIDARPRDGNHQLDAIIDFGIAMKINRKQTDSHNTAATKFFGHSSQKDVNYNASTGQDWFSLARIFTLILRGTSIDSLDAEIQMSLTGLDMRNEIQTLGFNDKVVDSMTELIIQSTKSSCEQHETVSKLARIGKEITKSL